MRLHLSLLFSAALLSGCAYEGVVVEKSQQAFPMYLSHGVEGQYTFIVRDKGGALHRQMVTPDVFERYAIGQYFNDQETGAAGTIEEGKTVQSQTMTASNAQRTNGVRYASKPAAQRAAKTTIARTTSKQTPRPTAKAKARRAAIAAAKRKRSKPTKAAVTVAHIAPIAPAPVVAMNTAKPVPVDNDLRVVTIARCR